MLQFSAPRRVRNFDSQHPTGELNRPCAACHRRSAGQGPSQQGGLGARRFSQAAGNYFFHVWRDWVHGSFDFNIRKGLWDCSKLSDYARVELESDPAAAKGDGFVIATLFAKQIAANVAARQVRDNLFVPRFSA
jgi:hypothetical protein